MPKKKRIVTITIRGEVPDSADFVSVVADVLENHARDLRDEDSVVGNMARGFQEVRHDGQFFRVDWEAVYEDVS